MLQKLNGSVGFVIKITVEIFLVLHSIVTALACFYCLFHGLFIWILWLVLELIGAWIVAMFLYGFGTIVQNSEKIVEKIEKNNETEESNLSSLKVTNEKIDDLQHEFSQWQTEIKKLSDDELAERLKNQKDWQDEYIILCHAEIKRRESNKGC